MPYGGAPEGGDAINAAYHRSPSSPELLDGVFYSSEKRASPPLADFVVS